MFLLKLGSELQNLVKKFAVQYENINKLQTGFPRSGMLQIRFPLFLVSFCNI